MRSSPIAEFTVEALTLGTRERLWLDVMPGLAGPLRLPALVAKGTAAGPTLLAVAGVHGDEYEGMEAIRRVFARLDPARLRGAFVGIPVANPLAYEARTRATPSQIDGLNLARVFPGDPAGTPTRVLADALLALALRVVGPDDLLLDFHSGSADVAYARLVGVRDLPGPAHDRAEEAARRFGLPSLWRIPDSPGPFNAETARRGLPTLGTETTGRAGCLPADVAAFARGLAGLLAHLGIAPDLPLPPRQEGPSRATIDLLAPTSGFLRHDRVLHEEVAAGETLGTIVDLFGEPLAEVAAPVAGTLWAVRATPAVRGGELLFMVAEKA